MIEINGKKYPLWSQFVERKKEWIGGVLEDHDMGMVGTTEIVDVKLEPNGDDSAFFSVEGKDFTCGFDVGVGSIGSGSEKPWLDFHGYAGHNWRIRQPDNQPDSAENR